MLLKNLIRNIPKGKKNINITGLAIDSNQIKKKLYFFCNKGNKINGEKLIKDAIKKGASVIVCSESYKSKDKFVLIIKKNVRLFLSEIMEIL